MVHLRWPISNCPSYWIRQSQMLWRVKNISSRREASSCIRVSTRAPPPPSRTRRFFSKSAASMTCISLSLSLYLSLSIYIYICIYTCISLSLYIYKYIHTVYTHYIYIYIYILREIYNIYISADGFFSGGIREAVDLCDPRSPNHRRALPF